MGITASLSPARSGSVGSWRTSPRSGENHRTAGLGADLTAARQQLTKLLQGYHGEDEPGNSQTESPRLQLGLQFTTVRRRPGKTDQTTLVQLEPIRTAAIRAANAVGIRVPPGF